MFLLVHLRNINAGVHVGDVYFQLLASYGMNHGIEDKSVELTVEGKVKETNDSIPQWLIRKWIECFVCICQSIVVKHV